MLLNSVVWTDQLFFGSQIRADLCLLFRGHFHQRVRVFTSSFYTQDPKSTKSCLTWLSFLALLRSLSVKAARKHIGEIDPRGSVWEVAVIDWSRSLTNPRTQILTILRFIYGRIPTNWPTTSHSGWQVTNGSRTTVLPPRRRGVKGGGGEGGRRGQPKGSMNYGQ